MSQIDYFSHHRNIVKAHFNFWQRQIILSCISMYRHFSTPKSDCLLFAERAEILFKAFCDRYSTACQAEGPPRARTMVMLLARSFSWTLQGRISFVHGTDFSFVFTIPFSDYWYITHFWTRLAARSYSWWVRW